MPNHDLVNRDLAFSHFRNRRNNPTLSTLWKLSNGMKVPFNAQTVSPNVPYEVVRTAEMQPILEDDGKVKKLLPFSR